jgi:hypothetical protein
MKNLTDINFFLRWLVKTMHHLFSESEKSEHCEPEKPPDEAGTLEGTQTG